VTGVILLIVASLRRETPKSEGASQPVNGAAGE
jgi:hypothetical protein